MSRLATAPPPTRPAIETSQTPRPNGDDDFKRLMKNRFNDEELKAIEKIDAVSSECRGIMENAAHHMARALIMADGIATLRALITPAIMSKIMPLMNTRLGFRTDKDPNRPRWNKKTSQYDKVDPYPVAVVKECFIESLLYGAWPVGNEWNIIASNLYLTKEHFIRKVGDIPGVSNVVASPGIPQLATNGKTVIRYGLSWRYNGVADSLKDADGKPGRVFEIKSDEWSSADQIVGKADRKAYASAYRQITGSQITLPEGEADDVSELNGHGKPRSGVIGERLDKPAETPADPNAQAAPVDNGSQLPEAEQKPQMTTEEFDRIAREKTEAAAAAKTQTIANPTPVNPMSATQSEAKPDVSSWPRFIEAAVSAAGARGIDGPTARTGLHRAAMLLQRVGKEETISVAQREHWLKSINDGNFDFGTGKVVIPK